MSGKLYIVLVMILVSVNFVFSDDIYLEESRGHCTNKKDVFSCTKFRVLRYISNYTEHSFFEGSFGPVKITKYQDVDEGETFFSAEEPRLSSEDSEIGKFFKFVKRQVDHFLNHQSLIITLPEGARFISLGSELKGITDSRGKKKKADLLISLLTLFKIFKIKVLVALALAGILVIKKVLLVGAFVLPSVIHNLKISCMKAAQAAGTAYHHHVTGLEADHDDFGGGFGSYGANHLQFGGQHGDKFGTDYQRRQ